MGKIDQRLVLGKKMFEKIESITADEYALNNNTV